MTPILSTLLVHDLLLAKKGISLPASHGLRAAVDRHKARLQAEFSKARVRRKLSSLETFKAFIESGLENGSAASESPYPRWIRINTLKTTLEDQLESTFVGFDRVLKIEDVRQRGSKCIFIDQTVPNLVAISPNLDLSKGKAYKSGAIIFQDKASCFPAYLLDPLHEDGDIIDTCSAPGNKTTHLAAILLAHSPEAEECSQLIHAFEKNKGRAETLEKMVNLAGSHTWTKLHPGQDFLSINPELRVFRNVGALLLDPSCSGSGIVGRDDMPELQLPVLKQGTGRASKHLKKGAKAPERNEDRKRSREAYDDLSDVMVDDDGEVTAVNSGDEMKARLDALSNFQMELLLHAFKFPAARKITYSTCSIYAEENESVVRKALDSNIAKERGWRIIRRESQIRGMRKWPVRGDVKACGGDYDLADSCIRANKDDEHGTMGFFLAGFTRDQNPSTGSDAGFLKDERGHLVRDLMGFPVRVEPAEVKRDGTERGVELEQLNEDLAGDYKEEWNGFGDEATAIKPVKCQDNGSSTQALRADGRQISNHAHSMLKKRPQLGPKPNIKRRKQ